MPAAEARNAGGRPRRRPPADGRRSRSERTKALTSHAKVVALDILPDGPGAPGIVLHLDFTKDSAPAALKQVWRRGRPGAEATWRPDHRPRETDHIRIIALATWP